MTRTECLRILDLEANASHDDVVKAYRQLVQIWHPDRFPNNPELKARANARLAKINEAYNALISGRATDCAESPDFRKADPGNSFSPDISVLFEDEIEKLPRRRSANLDEEVWKREKALATLEGTIAKLSKERRSLSWNRGRLWAVRIYLVAATGARPLVDNSIVWRPGAILISVTVFGGTALAIHRSVLTAGVMGITTSVIAFGLMFYPDDLKLRRFILACDDELRRIAARAREVRQEIDDNRSMAEQMRGNINELRRTNATVKRMQSTEFRLRQLLAENWKAMRSVEFEEFLRRVFEELGYGVQTTKTSGDQGVDLVLFDGNRRLAVQVKGYLNSVSNSAVQEVFAGQMHYRCDGAIVITNSRFTPSAIELANSVGCVLISEDEMESMVLGHIDLFGLCLRRM